MSKNNGHWEIIEKIKNVANNDANNVANKKAERQQKILALIQENPSTTRAEIAQAIGLSTKTIERELTALSDVIRYVGAKNNGHWEIIRQI